MTTIITIPMGVTMPLSNKQAHGVDIRASGNAKAKYLMIRDIHPPAKALSQALLTMEQPMRLIIRAGHLDWPPIHQ